MINVKKTTKANKRYSFVQNICHSVNLRTSRVVLLEITFNANSNAQRHTIDKN